MDSSYGGMFTFCGGLQRHLPGGPGSPLSPFGPIANCPRKQNMRLSCYIVTVQNANIASEGERLNVESLKNTSVCHQLLHVLTSPTVHWVLRELIILQFKDACLNSTCSDVITEWAFRIRTHMAGLVLAKLRHIFSMDRDDPLKRNLKILFAFPAGEDISAVY